MLLGFMQLQDQEELNFCLVQVQKSLVYQQFVVENQSWAAPIGQISSNVINWSLFIDSTEVIPFPNMAP